jgi:hypothetical protein
MSAPHHWQNFPEASVSFPHFGQNISSLLISNIEPDALFNLTVLGRDPSGFPVSSCAFVPEQCPVLANTLPAARFTAQTS